MPEVSTKESVCSAGSAGEACKCGGVCTGYATQSECPPLIVLAVLAVSQAALTHGPAVVNALKAGGR